MALTVNRINVFTVAASEEAKLAHVLADVVFSPFYPSGGEALTPTTLGLATIRHLQAEQKGGRTRLVEYDYANSLLKLYTALGTEAANNSDQSMVTVRVLALGRWGA